MSLNIEMNQTEKLHINILLVFEAAVAVKIRDYVYAAAYVQATQHTHDTNAAHMYNAFIDRTSSYGTQHYTHQYEFKI